jgi:hypothetical protein
MKKEMTQSFILGLNNRLIHVEFCKSISRFEPKFFEKAAKLQAKIFRTPMVLSW